MYNEKLKCWESGAYDEDLLVWCREPFNQDNPEALFVLADSALAQASSGRGTADGVYLLERAAELGEVRAALAMGQLFRFGWGVHRSGRTARKWYEKAAAMGCEEARAFLLALEGERRRKGRAAALAAVAVVAAGIFLGVLWRNVTLEPQEIFVHEETVLVIPKSPEEFNRALNDLVTQYDDKSVVSGEGNSGRLLVKFEGEGIDLSDFPAAVVLADKDNYLVIQFASQEEAERCLEALGKLDGVVFAVMDGYDMGYGDGEASTGEAVFRPMASSGPPYLSVYSGMSYYSWGVEFMGLDRLAGWLQARQAGRVTVAVLDTGVELQPGTWDRILAGADIAAGDTHGWEDNDGHGTHVAGIIYDCTQGLDVFILPVRVFTPDGNGLTSYVVQGLKYAMDSSVDVINISLGGSCAATAPQENCGDPVDYYIRQAVDQGIVVVIAAGNGDEEGNPEDTRTVCPGHMGEGIVTGACDRRGNVGEFSNYGESVDLCAPGVDVVSYYSGNTFRALSGTSMAAPHVSALAAMLKLYLPDKSPAQLEGYICDYCIHGGDPFYYGYGIPWAAYFAGD